MLVPVCLVVMNAEYSPKDLIVLHEIIDVRDMAFMKMLIGAVHTCTVFYMFHLLHMLYNISL